MSNLCVIAFLWIAALGVLQAPVKKGQATDHGAGDTSQTSKPRNAQQSSTAAPDQAVPAPGQKIEPSQAKTEQSRDDIEIQRQLAKYTKGLVWVGILQAIVLAGTLVVMWRQAKIMGTHADHLACLAGAAGSTAIAAKASAEILQKSQRPQIAVGVSGDPSKTIADMGAPRVLVSLTNRGPTTAYDCLYQSWIEVLPFPFVDFTPIVDHFESTEPFGLYPGNNPIVLNVPFRKGLTEAERADIFKVRRYVCIRIYMKFRDVFGPDQETNFGIYIMKEGFGFRPKYNSTH
jgi:hypothetical protein